MDLDDYNKFYRNRIRVVMILRSKFFSVQTHILPNKIQQQTHTHKSLLHKTLTKPKIPLPKTSKKSHPIPSEKQSKNPKILPIK